MKDRRALGLIIVVPLVAAPAAFDGFVHERDGLGAEAGFGRILGRPAPRFFRSSAAGRATVLTRYFLLKGRSSPGHVSLTVGLQFGANSFQISDFGCRAYPRGLVLPPGGGRIEFFFFSRYRYHPVFAKIWPIKMGRFFA